MCIAFFLQRVFSGMKHFYINSNTPHVTHLLVGYIAHNINRLTLLFTLLTGSFHTIHVTLIHC